MVLRNIKDVMLRWKDDATASSPTVADRAAAGIAAEKDTPL